MIYKCNSCGKRYTKGFESCPSCGGAMYIDSPSKNDDKAPLWINLVALFIPLIGFIMFFMCRKKYPRGAKSVLICAIVGFFINSGIRTLHNSNKTSEDRTINNSESLINDIIQSNNDETYSVNVNGERGKYQVFNDGDIEVTSIKVYRGYSDSKGRDTLFLDMKCSVKEKCACTFYIHFFNDYKEYYGTEEVYERFDGKGNYEVTYEFSGGNIWFYYMINEDLLDEINYFVLSNKSRFYDKELMTQIV